jgi:transposase-like protein
MTKGEQARLLAWRLRILQHAGEGGRPVARTCRHFGSSRKNFYEWKQRYERDGVTGLCDRPRRPRHAPGALSQDIISKLLALWPSS